MAPVRIAVLGAGLIGRRHAEAVAAEPEAALAAVVDPSEAGRAVAAERGVAWYPGFDAMLRAERPEAAIIATPNRMHVEHGLDVISAGIPAIVEKPLADDVPGATRLVEAAEAAGIPLMVGHHRRHNPLVRAAKEAIAAGRIGKVVAAQAICWFFKPPEYFDAEWRRLPGAGPVFLNLIHDVDLLRLLCGEVRSVQAMESNAERGHAVEDTAAILLRFAGGALGTVSVSDTVVSPWSWEFTSGENPVHTQTAESCCLIGGTSGSLSVPSLDLWHHANRPSWWEPIGCDRLPVTQGDPLRLQVRNLCRVVRGTEAPVAPAREGLETLKVIAAVKAAAATGRTVTLA